MRGPNWEGLEGTRRDGSASNTAARRKELSTRAGEGQLLQHPPGRHGAAAQRLNPPGPLPLTL